MGDKYDGTESDQASKKMLASAGVKWRKVPEIKIGIDK